MKRYFKDQDDVKYYVDSDWVDITPTSTSTWEDLPNKLTEVFPTVEGVPLGSTITMCLDVRVVDIGLTTRSTWLWNVADSKLPIESVVIK